MPPDTAATEESCPDCGGWATSKPCPTCAEPPGTAAPRWWHRWFPPYSRVYDHCPESPDGQHETHEVSGPGAAGLHQDYEECVRCGRFW